MVLYISRLFLLRVGILCGSSTILKYIIHSSSTIPCSGSGWTLVKMAFYNSNNRKSVSTTEFCLKTSHCLFKHKSISWRCEATQRAHQLLATARWMGWLLELMWQLRFKARDSITCVQTLGAHFYMIIYPPRGPWNWHWSAVQIFNVPARKELSCIFFSLFQFTFILNAKSTSKKRGEPAWKGGLQYGSLLKLSSKAALWLIPL